MKDGPTHSFIYFAKTPCGRIKVGCTTNVQGRMKTIGGELLFLLEGASFRETALHFLLRDARLHGEYFEDCGFVRGFIKRAEQGDYSGLISDVPRFSQRYQLAPYRNSSNRDRPVRFLRESLGITVDQLSADCGIALSTAACSDSQTAPHYLSGRVAQYLIGVARGRGLPVNSHHLTGLYCRDLKGLVSSRPNQLADDRVSVDVPTIDQCGQPVRGIVDSGSLFGAGQVNSLSFSKINPCGQTARYRAVTPVQDSRDDGEGDSQ